MRRKQRGFTLVELLVSLLMMSIMMTAMTSTFVAQNHASVKRDTYLEMDENLRMGLATLSSMLRNAGYGIPTANLNQWITTVSGFTNQPLFVAGNGSINLASCTPIAVAKVTVDAVVGNTTLTIDSASQLKNGDLIWIGQSEFAKVLNAGTTLSIDTNPMMSGTQGLARNHVAESPICRADVVTFFIQEDPWDTTKQSLLLDRHDGLGAQVVAQGVNSIQLTTVTAGERYLLTMTAKTKDPYSGNYVTRTRSTDIALVN
jgi:prepilin-type N-terminal cleavage/methylation domain-containing protein